MNVSQASKGTTMVSESVCSKGESFESLLFFTSLCQLSITYDTLKSIKILISELSIYRISGRVVLPSRGFDL